METFEPRASPHGHLLLSHLEGHIRQAATPGGPCAHALHLSPSNTTPWPQLFGQFFPLPGTTCKGTGSLEPEDHLVFLGVACTSAAGACVDGDLSPKGRS